jgi:hypothetical protein
MEHWTVLTGQAVTMPCSSVKDWHPFSDLKAGAERLAGGGGADKASPFDRC